MRCGTPICDAPRRLLHGRHRACLLVAPEEVAVRGRKSGAVKVEALDADGSVIKGVLVALKATGLSCRVSVLSFDADADHGSRT